MLCSSTRADPCSVSPFRAAMGRVANTVEASTVVPLLQELYDTDSFSLPNDADFEDIANSHVEFISRLLASRHVRRRLW